MDFTILAPYGALLWRGLQTTCWLVLISGGLGFALAIVFAFGRLSANRLVSGACLSVSTLIRGTPLLVQIFFLYYGVGLFLGSTPSIRHSFLWPYLREGFWYVALSLTVSVAIYVGEVVRAGLISVPAGEIEAARAFGMSRGKLIGRVWLPRALQQILPTLAGETVLLLKSTALASTVAVVDLMGAAGIARSQTARVYEPLLAVALVYLVLTFLITRIFGVLERRVQLKRR